MHHLLQLRRYLPPVERHQQCIVITPVFFSGHYKYKPVYSLNLFLTKVIVKLLTRTVSGIDIITDSPFFMPVINSIPVNKIAAYHYDIIDDFTVFNWSPAWGETLNRSLLSQAKSITTGTLSLAKKYKEIVGEKSIVFVPVGIDTSLFSNLEHISCPRDIETFKHKKIIGYVGSINDRLDFKLIQMIADQFSNTIILMIGPIRISSDKLPKGENIVWLGSKAHKDLPAYISQFSVAIIPFVLDDASKKLFPVKTMEYLSCGVPVVSVALPDVEVFFGDLVYTSTSAEEICLHIKDLLAGKANHPIAQGIEFSMGHTWDNMAKNIIENIREF